MKTYPFPAAYVKRREQNGVATGFPNYLQESIDGVEDSHEGET